MLMLLLFLLLMVVDGGEDFVDVDVVVPVVVNGGG